MVFSPKYLYNPSSEKEVLDILNRHKDAKIRVRGSLHAWSDVVSSEDVIIDLKNIKNIIVEKDKNGDSWTTVSGGCVLSELTNYLNSLGLTVPTLGAIQRQTIAGAISTGTHGSGNSSISHYIQEIRVAAYDSGSGRAKIYEFKEGDRLRAARCSLGCMGVILSVKFKCPKDYWIEEKTTVFENITEVLDGEKEYPLQQFGLLPFKWEFIAYQRRTTNNVPRGLGAFKMSLLKLADYLGTEVLTHFAIKLLANFSNKGADGGRIRWFYKDFITSFINPRTVANQSIRALTLHTSHHDLFQHLEMEVFIPSVHIKKAAEAVRWVTSVFSDSRLNLPEEVVVDIKKAGMLEELIKNKGSYTQHYPLFFRRVLPDDTLISMTSGGQTYYSLSFFTYLSPDKRERFYNYAGFMARLLLNLYDARLHWGKYFPLLNKDIERLYPNLPFFRQLCNSVDPKGVFRNKFTSQVLGFP